MKRKLSCIILALMLSLVSFGAFAAGEDQKAPAQPAQNQTASAGGAQTGETQPTAQDANAAKADQAGTAQDAKAPTGGAQGDTAQNQAASADGAQAGTAQNQNATADGAQAGTAQNQNATADGAQAGTAQNQAASADGAQAASGAQGANADADTAQPETALTVTAENSQKDVSVALNLDDAAINDFLAKYAARTDKNAPAVLDLTALGAEIGFVELPSRLINAILNDGVPADPVQTPSGTQAEETAGDGTVEKAETGTTGTAAASNDQAVTAPEEQPQNADGTDTAPEAVLPATSPEQVILLIHTHGKDYSWKRGTLQALPLAEATVKLEMGKADQTMVFNMPEDAPQKDPSALDFKPQDGKYKGVLSVAKTAEGTWKVTGSYMFGSVGSYIVAIVLLVLLTLLIMIAVNLLIIKIYRAK